MNYIFTEEEDGNKNYNRKAEKNEYKNVNRGKLYENNVILL